MAADVRVRATAGRDQVTHRAVSAPTSATEGTHIDATPAHALGMALSDPAKLSVGHVATLQRSCGNKATAALLHRPPHPPRPKPKALPVQRFPASALTAPAAWSQLTGDVSRPGEGISGGVYILTSNQKDPDLDKVVVKPVFGSTGLGDETPEQLQFGDRALSSLLGVSTPVSRIVHPRTREYSELVTLLRPHQPPPPTTFDRDNPSQWKDLSAAHGLIVMSKVPNAKSAVSYAKEAATDEKAKNDLYRVVFGKPFLEQLARISVGDLMLGNVDRMMFGTMNLGNIMISMAEGGDATLYAIDTTAYLPKAVDTAKIVDSGSTYGGASSATKVMMDKPEERLEGFYRMLVSNMKAADKGGHPEGAAPWQLFENAYKAQKDRIEFDFLLGWRKVLLEIKAMVSSREGKEKMKGLTAGYAGTRGEQTLGYGALKANAMYLASRTTKFDKHEESSADPAAYYAYSKLTGLDTGKFLPPTDELTPAVDVTMPGLAKKHTFTLPTYLPYGLAHGFGGAKQISPADRVTNIKEQVARYESQLEALGTKKKGVFKAKQVERNRVIIGKYVANTFRLVAGAGRLRYHMNQVDDAAKDVLYTLGGNLKREQVAKAIPNVVRALLPAFNKLVGDSTAYLPKLAQARDDFASAKDYGLVADNLSSACKRLESILKIETKQMQDTVRKDGKDHLVDMIRNYVNS